MDSPMPSTRASGDAIILPARRPRLVVSPSYELAIAPSTILVVVSIPDLNTPTVMMDPPSPQWADVGQEHHIAPELTFVESKCSRCHATMPPGDARKSCSSCLNEKKDGRSAQSRAKKMKTTKCTKCPNDLDPRPSEARYRRCRRCREETTRTQRRQGVKPKTGQDEICPFCDGVMIDARYESCEACRFGPRVIALSGRRCKDRKSPPPSNQDSTSGNVAAAGMDGHTTTPCVYPDLPPPSAMFYSPSLSSTSQNDAHTTPSNASGSNLSLTPLSFAGSFSSDSPHTSWNGTPDSAYGKHALPPLDSTLGLGLSHIYTRTVSGSGRVYSSNVNPYPHPASAPTYSHPLPYDPDCGGTSTFNYLTDSRLRPSPISFSTPLHSVALPDEADSQYIDYDYDPLSATPSSSYQSQRLYHDHVEVEGIHSPSSYAVSLISDISHGDLEAGVDDPNGITYASS
ncbi:hypothetical protein BDN71DRAFT_1431728 [Pleurotus eryngii]|uniref:Uncharacterized protein n=1 Tax=Pleurotus eryngii TaxID=5323 RepID=A0A9P6D6D4_PLEER|nr:hypothetical protein BDN71DRAFT_1431728 [Pleurotus eryngii]